MPTQTRRQFLQNAGIGIATTTVLRHATANAASASERVRIAVIGCGNQSRAYINKLRRLNDSEIVYVSDIDSERLAKALKETSAAKGAADFGHILDAEC